MADYYPSGDRIGYDYTPGTVVGVVGGIPNRTNEIDVTQSPYNADNTGATFADSAIQSAVAAAGSGDVVYLPAGTYKISGIGVTHTQSNITIRGAGSGALTGEATTTLDVRGVAGIANGTDVDWANPGNPHSAITVATMTRGSTTITVADGSIFTAGSLARIYFENDPDPSRLVVSVFGFANSRFMQVKIVSKAGNVLTISKPLPCSFTSVPSAEIWQSQYATQVGVGVENIHVDMANSSNPQYGVKIAPCDNCWIKNVRISSPGNYGVYATETTNFEMRHCWVEPSIGSGSNHSGLLLNTGSYALIVDNVFDGCGPNIEVNFGTIGSVIAYNYFKDASDGRGIDTNHGPHNSFNLYEGNAIVGCIIQADGYFGSVEADTFYRGWFNGLQSNGSSISSALGLKRLTRNYNAIGNIMLSPGSHSWGEDGFGYSDMGNPNLGNGSYIGTAEPSTGDWWLDWNTTTNLPKSWTGTLTTRTTDTSGVITLGTGQGADFAAHCEDSLDNNFYAGFAGVAKRVSVVGDVVTFNTASSPCPDVGTAVTLRPGQSGFQEKDLDVENTLLRKANFNYWENAIPSGDSIGSDTLADSYAYSAKPSWFGDLAWPAYDPYNTGSLTQDDLKVAIPAGYRYINGEDPPSDTQAVQPTFSPGSATFNATQSVTISTTTPSASIYYTTDGSTPDNTDTLYTTPVSITATTTLKAIAYASGLDPSTVRTGVYTLKAATPSFSPAAGTYGSAQSVTISCATSGASIYYTTDGSTPDNTDTLYTSPVSITSTTTLRAIAYKSPLDPSSVFSGAFTISSGGPTGLTVNGTLSAAVWAF